MNTVCASRERDVHAVVDEHARLRAPDGGHGAFRKTDETARIPPGLSDLNEVHTCAGGCSDPRDQSGVVLCPGRRWRDHAQDGTHGRSVFDELRGNRKRAFWRAARENRDQFHEPDGQIEYADT